MRRFPRVPPPEWQLSSTAVKFSLATARLSRKKEWPVMSCTTPPLTGKPAGRRLSTGTKVLLSPSLWSRSGSAMREPWPEKWNTTTSPGLAWRIRCSWKASRIPARVAFASVSVRMSLGWKPNR